jgi:predicted glycogen debranching enzyme
MIEFGEDICRNYAEAASREWLETNGLGGFASSTISGLNTRRYHALLTAATSPPVGRVVMLSKLEETLVINGDRFELATNLYPDTIYPRGFELLESFRLDPFPVFTWRIEDVAIEKSVFMIQGENATVVQYRFSGSGKARLELRPLIAFRDFHSTEHENSDLNRHVEFGAGIASIAPYYGQPNLHFAHNAAAAVGAGDWYRNFEYEEERHRGLDFREDLFHPLTLSYELTDGAQAIVIASTGLHRAEEAASLEKRERERRHSLAAASPARQNDFVTSLTSAADQFIAARESLKTIIAGYHWFSDWGRDTMISLPGLTLVTGKFDVARQILLAFAKYVDQGMLPNVFPSAGEAPEYNTVDATLWYFEAIRQYAEYSRDSQTVRKQLYPVLVDIIEWHRRGTRYGIRLDQDGLLLAGEPGVQLTWMDAKIGNWVVTPRTGKAVEIQALWYNALRTMEEFAKQFGEIQHAQEYAAMAQQAYDSFNRQFWNERTSCLYDVINDNGNDGSIRPNQVFAVSLPFAVLDSNRAKAVIDKVEAELLTPVGLRTLSQHDPHYIGTYGGNPLSRDSAYHQGTVWPWLIGPFISAYLKIHNRSKDSIERAESFLDGLQQHLAQAGLGTISEIFCGDAPYPPCGCIAQAWSVAEVLRVVVTELQMEVTNAGKP